MEPVRVAIFDDHPIFLNGLVGVFSELDQFNVVGKGSCASDAVKICSSEKTDIVVLDLDMPGNAFEAIINIKSAQPEAKVLVFTASVVIDHAVRALEAGASGYVIKGSTAEELVNGIHAVLNGDTFVTQSFAVKVITALRNASMRKMAAQAMRLSVREDQILRLLLRGKTNKEIAIQLSISEKTVKHYMSILMSKLNARNRIEVVLAAQKLEANPGDSAAFRYRN